MSSSGFGFSASPSISPARLVAIASNGGSSQNGQDTPAPIVPGKGQPTPRELARTAFKAVFSGPIYDGPGRYTDQARIIYFRGAGSTNFFLHGDYQMAFVFPKDTTAPIAGAVYMQDKNINSGGLVGFDLVADATSLDKRGRPTRATFVADPNIYGGIFFFDTAQGTVNIKYHGNNASVVFQGHVYTNGLTNPLTNSDIVARNGRLKHRS